MAGPAYLAQKREVSPFVVPMVSAPLRESFMLPDASLPAVEAAGKNGPRATECASIFYGCDVNFRG
jgi:hypothetical protein